MKVDNDDGDRLVWLMINHNWSLFATIDQYQLRMSMVNEFMNVDDDNLMVINYG